MSYGVEALVKGRAEIDSELRKHKSPVTVMFTDLAGSTSYFDRHGDTAGVQWIEKHNAIVIPVVEQYGGTVVKTIGDSVMAYFHDAVQAATAARSIEQSLLGANAHEEPDHQMFVRVALHQGLGYLRGGDVFGDVVNVTARLAKLCLPAQILVSESVYRAAHDNQELQFSELGTQQLRGKTGTENLYELAFTDPETYTTLRERFRPKPAAQKEELSSGRYEVLAELGRGAMGVVYKAYDRVIGRVVAMKTIPLEVGAAEKEHLVARLQQEARAAGVLDHPNIITVFDVGEEAGIFYFTMQYVEGRTFADMVADKQLLPLDRILEVMVQVCSAVGAAHSKGIIHRDLKPSNLMLTRQGIAKVLDFGIAKLGEAGLTQAGMIMGTPSYLSPEQAGGRRLDARSDIFSLGAVLYELITGERAFPGESTTAIIYKVMNDDPIPPIVVEPSLPPGLDAVIRKALMKNPQKRFQTAEEMADALKNCREVVIPVPERTVVSHTPLLEEEPSATLVTPAARPPSRALWIAVAVVVVLAVSAGGFWWSRSSANSAPQPAPTASQPSASLPAPTATAAPESAKPDPSAGKGLAETSKSSAFRTAKTTARGEKQPAQTSEAAPTAKAPPSHPKEQPADEAAPASGMFTRNDIPDLLSKADRYAGRGDYQKAIYLYGEILKLDPKHAAAQAGLQRAHAAQQSPH